MLKTTTQALQVQSDGSMAILDDIELPTTTATVAPVLSAARDLLAVGEGDRLVRIWRGKIGDRELIEPPAHPARLGSGNWPAHYPGHSCGQEHSPSLGLHAPNDRRMVRD